MKTVKMKVVLLTTTALLAVSANTAFGQISVTFDENGHGSYTSTLIGNGTLGSGVAADPISGIQTLRYLVGVPLTPGDVLLFEDAASGLPSDIVRFSPNPNNTSQSYIYFFSDKEATDVAPFDLADVDQMPQPATNFVHLVETGIEGQNGALYVPGANDPGSYPGIQLTYNILSDVVPEPSGLALLSIGGGLLLLFRRRLYARN